MGETAVGTIQPINLALDDKVDTTHTRILNMTLQPGDC